MNPILKKTSSKFLFGAFILASISLFSCTNKITKYGRHYQKHNDYKSLHKVVGLMELKVDTAYVKKILGEPIDMGFDYRYLIDSTGTKGCPIGAVFHINSDGKIDQKWLDEICE